MFGEVSKLRRVRRKAPAFQIEIEYGKRSFPFSFDSQTTTNKVSIYGGDNLWVTMAIGSVSAGAGAVIGGAETAEEILFGMATGAIVGVLNHYVHKGEEKVDETKLAISIEKGVVLIDNEDKYTVRASLKYPRQVAAIAKEMYLEKYGVKLNISNSSLEKEIMYHALAYKIGFMKENAKIANCGEGSFFKKSGDTNRWVWDLFSGAN